MSRLTIFQNLQSRCAAAPWMVLVISAYVFIAPNVDLVAALQWHDGQRLGQLVLLAAGLLILARPAAFSGVADAWMCLRPQVRHAWSAAFALGLVSSLHAALPRWAFLEWGMLLLLLWLTLAVAAERRRIGSSLDVFLTGLLFATATAYAVSGITIYLTMLLAGPAYGLGFSELELYHGFSNVRFFGYVQTMLLPFLLLPALWWGTTRMRRVLLWSVPSFWWMLTVGSGSRGTWVALLAGMIAVTLFAGRPGRQWIRWQLVALFLGLLGYLLFIRLLPHWLESQSLIQPAAYLQRPGDILSLSLREVLWTQSLEFSAHHPWLGTGPMHYAHYGARVAAHPHNAVLQWLAEWGIPAALLLTSVFAVAGLVFAGHVRRIVRTIPDQRVPVQIALLAALTGAAAQSMVDGVLVMPVSQILLVLLGGWAVALYLEERRRVARGGALTRSVILIVAVIAAVMVYRGVAPEIGSLAEREQAYLLAYPPENPALPSLMPRFWTQGRIE